MEQNQKWAFCPVSGEKRYAGILTALRPDASEEQERRDACEGVVFGPEDEGKCVVIDRKKIAEKREPDYDMHRFQAVQIEDGRLMWEQGTGYLQTWLELTQKADELQGKYENESLMLTAEDLEFESRDSGISK